jgi:protein dispatched 1
MWYFKVLARKPHLILLAIIVFSVATIIVSLTRTFPDFSDPTLVSPPKPIVEQAI